MFKKCRKNVLSEEITFVQKGDVGKGYLDIGGSGWGETAVFHVNHDFARYWVVGARYSPDAAVLVALARFLSHGYRIGREPQHY